MKKLQELAIRIARIEAAKSAQRTMTLLRAHQPTLDVKASIDE